MVSFANLPDETTALAHLVLPDTHWLESWGDYSPREGVVGLMQPTMQPIRDSRALGDMLLAVGRAVLGTEEGKGPLPWPTYEQFVKAAWEPTVKGRWAETLSQGGAVAGRRAGGGHRRRSSAVDVAPAKLEGEGDGLALLAYPSFRFYDGRSASRSWLQETPDTMTQAVWDPWVEINTETATKLGIRQGDVVTVTSPHGAIEVPRTSRPRSIRGPSPFRSAIATRRTISASSTSRRPPDRRTRWRCCRPRPRRPPAPRRSCRSR